jgi:tRNA-dihydrouridine synthase
MKSFWDSLPRPFFTLAPLADVTDAAFRRVIAARGKPDVMWTEFVSADGLMRAPEQGREKLMRDLIFTDSERPIIAQFFTSDPKAMEYAAGLAARLGFDGIDINMGCPDRSIERQGAGAALIKAPEVARALIRAARRGAPALPVSVKTRIGYARDELATWLPALLSENPAAVTIHARTRKEMSKVPAQWERVRAAVELRDRLNSSTLIIGNGDALSLEEARRHAEASGCDGVMLGRAIFGNPWLWAKGVPSARERLLALAEHSALFEELLPHKNFAVMKKHFKSYLAGLPAATEEREVLHRIKELRHELMACGDACGVARAIGSYLGEPRSTQEEELRTGALSV